MRPRPPLPGPVASEAAQMSIHVRDKVVHAGAVAAHYAAGHDGLIEDCDPCMAPVDYPNREAPR